MTMATTQRKFSFKKLTQDDFGLIERWLMMPHVKEFWDDGETWQESYEKYVFRTSSNTVFQYLVFLEDRPIGYAQYYWAKNVGDGWWPDADESTVGTDQYIGEPDCLGRGIGTEMVGAFLRFVLQNETIGRVILDPAPNNYRAIRCYEKVGFKKIGLIDTPDGPAMLMELGPEKIISFRALITIKESPIHGLGVFAARDVKKGETIIDWNGCAEILTPFEAKDLPPSEKKYLSVIDGQYVLFKPPARFVNHSCDPNAKGSGGRDFAVRDIKAGDEITVDYVIEKVPGLDLQCNCGTKQCRGHLRVSL